MSEIINLEEIRLSKLDHDELLVESIEKLSEHMITQSKLVKDLTERITHIESWVLPILDFSGVDSGGVV